MSTDSHTGGVSESRSVTDDSYPLSRELVHRPCIGWTLRGAADPETVERTRAVFLEELSTEGLPQPSIRVTQWNVGRSAQGSELLLYVAGGIFALAAGVKQIDEAIAVLRKWWRAVKRAHTRLGGRRLTTEALKLACIDDVAEVHGGNAAPDIDSILATPGAAQYADGTWLPTSPVYIVLPDRTNLRTYLLVVRGDGEILYRAVIQYFHDDRPEEYRLGPVLNVASVEEFEPDSSSELDLDGESA